MTVGRFGFGLLASTVCLVALCQSAQAVELPLPAAYQDNLGPAPLPQRMEMALGLPEEKPEALAATTVEDLPAGGKMQIQAEDPRTGKTINIDINSNELNYDPQTDMYTVTGDVYIIIPDKNTEILADKVTFNSNTSTMVALGNVFIIKDKNVLGTEEASFDLDKNISYYGKLKSVTEHLQLKAESGQRADTYTILNNGRLLVDEETVLNVVNSMNRQGLRFGTGSIYSYYSASRSRLLNSMQLGRFDVGSDGATLSDSVVMDEEEEEDITGKVVDKPISPNDVIASNLDETDSPYRLKAKVVDVHRDDKGFDEIVFKQATIRYKNVPVLYTPYADFGYIRDQSFLTYLGPDFGYNVDYGGMYLGPGFDFQALGGWFHLSPIVSYGGGRRLRPNRGEPTQIDPQLGYGFLGHFRSPVNQTDFGYSNTLQEPIFLMEQRLFNRKSNTRLRLGAKQFYTNGFFGIERPRLIGEVTHFKQFRPVKSLMLRTYLSAGAAQDDFFPNRQSRFFVDPTSEEAITTGRLQLQGQLITLEPIVQLGKYGVLGAISQARVSLYGTGDKYLVAQAGPYANLTAGPFFTQLRYYYTQTAGETPFVFDSYFRGRNNIQSINSIDLGKYFTIGAVHGFAVNRDNARGDLLVDRRFFISAGSQSLRFSVAVDVINKRSYFGITLNPEGGSATMDFDTLNIYQPDFNGFPSGEPPINPLVAPSRKHNPQPAASEQKKDAATQKAAPGSLPGTAS